MERVQEFLAMGGYAVYVWPSYLVAAVVLGALFALSQRGLRAAERELADLEGPAENTTGNDKNDGTDA